METELTRAVDVNDGGSKDNLHFDDQRKQLVSLFFHRSVLQKKQKTWLFSEFLSGSSRNLLAFYHEWRSLIGYATHNLFHDR